jgi:bacterioferritin
MAVSLPAPGLKAQFTAHAASELQHADQLGERIQQLGGVPVYNPVEIAAQAAAAGTRPEQGATLSAMVSENLVMERRQVAAYTALIREIGEKDPSTRHLLTGILAEKEKHVRELADYLKLTAEVRQ